MLRHERRLLLDCLLIGAALTLLVVVIDSAGLLTPAENFLYDFRARTCQRFTPPPTDTLIHLDIDDSAVDAIGSWPWPRRVMARLFDEIQIAGPKAIEMDVLYSEPQRIEYQPREDGTNEIIDNDAELAAAMKRLGNVIVPALLEPVPKQSKRYAAMVAELRKDLELTEEELAVRIRTQGFPVGVEGLGEQYYPARRDAIMQRLAAMKPGPDTKFEEVRAQLMPRTRIDIHPALETVVAGLFEKYLTNTEYAKFSSPVPEGMTHWTEMYLQLAPVRKFATAASGGAFANYPKFGTSVIRTLPLLLEREGRVYPQMGLALACRMLEADMQHMRIEGNQLVVPREAAREIRIPLSPPRMSSEGFMFGCLMDVPWFGSANWEYMYDYPEHRVQKKHISLNEVWQAVTVREKILKNNRMMDNAIRGVYESQQDKERYDKYNAAIPPPEDSETRLKIAHSILDGTDEIIAELKKLKPPELDRRAEVMLASMLALKDSMELNPKLSKELEQFRTKLSGTMKGKAVLVGWIATAAIADFVPTSLHEKSPGVVVHGAVYNGIMTGEMWTRSPWWISALIAVALGMMTSLLVGYFSPTRSLILVAVLIAGYALVNGYWMFDYGNRIVGAASPLTAIMVVWAGCTLTRVIVEAIERERITRRFSTYADKRLVDYVLENPDISLSGEEREVTVVFTDLVGFTSLSERLGPKIVPVLNELLGELVPVIQISHQGYINKFLGDGIMFFYNAPWKHADHASDAVATVLDMREKLTAFNVKLRERDLPQLAMRAGIAAGTVVVGDAGSEHRSDYTCLGDAVNLSARLESANKIVGTNTLMNDRASEMLNGEFLIRPVGRIQVVGQENVSMCYEPLCRANAGDEKLSELAATSTMMVDAFITGRFEDCLKLVDQLEAICGAGKLTGAYRRMCQQYLNEAPPETFDGRIVLTEK